MAKFKYERQKPAEIARRAIEKGAQKIAQIISEEGFKIAPRVEGKLVSVVTDLEVQQDDIFKKALEILSKEQSVLPENLQEKYIDLVAKDLAEKVKSGQDLYQVLRQKMIEFKKQGIEIDGKEVEVRVKELL